MAYQFGNSHIDSKACFEQILLFRNNTKIKNAYNAYRVNVPLYLRFYINENFEYNNGYMNQFSFG